MGNLRIRDGDAMKMMWLRLRGGISGVEERVEIIEGAGYITQETDPTVPAWAKQSTKPTYTAAEVGAIPTAQKGSANGVAELDSGGHVPTSQLPSYVDDVLEYATSSAFPATGETGKIYVAINTNITYRWSGSGYVEISPSLALGETSSTAYRGDRGKAAYDHAEARGSAFNSGLYKIQTNGEGHVIGAVQVTKGDITNLGIPGDMPASTSELTNDGDGESPYATEDYVEDYGGKIDAIQVNGVTQPIVNKTVDLAMSVPITDAQIDEICDNSEAGVYSVYNFIARAASNTPTTVTAVTAWLADTLSHTAAARQYRPGTEADAIVAWNAASLTYAASAAALEE